MKNSKIRLFKALVLKELRHVIRDKRSLFILLALPVVMMLIFGFALSNEVKDSKIAIIDNARDISSQKLIDRIAQSEFFNIGIQIASDREVEPLLKSGEVLFVMVIPNNFDEDLKSQGESAIQLISDASDPNTANIAMRYVGSIIRDFQREFWPQKELPLSIHIENRMLYNPQLESTYNFVPGVMTLILMLLGAMMTSVAIVKEKELGTMEVLLVSPMQPIMVVLSKAVPYLFLCFIDVLVILLLSYTVLGMPIRGNLILLLLECTLFVITTLSLGLLISTTVESQQVAMFVSLVGFLMPAIVFSGFMFPIENMPEVLQIISNAVPTRWFFNIVRNIMVKGLGLSYILKDSIILLFMTLFFLLVALKNFKIRLE